MKIGELAQAAATQVETVRYYEKLGLLPAPERTAGNYRLYGAAHLERLQFIRRGRSLDLSLDEVCTLLRLKDAPQDDCADVNALLDAHIAHVSARLRELRVLHAQLVALRTQCHEVRDAAHCGILAGLSEAARAPARPGGAPAQAAVRPT